jgi:cellobiose-specific phosphotransferase system component IIC
MAKAGLLCKLVSETTANECRQKIKRKTMHLLLTPFLGSAIIIGGSTVGLVLLIVIVVLLVR